MTQLQIDFAFGLTIEQRLRIRIEEPFVAETGADNVACDPERPASIAALVDLHQAVVNEAAAYKL